MRFNIPLRARGKRTHEGAPAKEISPEAALRRSVLSCMLWEREFYEDGEAIADRILRNAAAVPKETVAALAVEARNVHGLRHAPLMLLLDLIRRGGPGVAEAVEATVRRADEMAELLALYWRDGKRPLSKQMKTGLAAAFGKFSEYELAKYDRDGAVKLRDVLFMTHPKPADAEQEALFARVAQRKLATPDTWEVSLSSGADKKESFERLLRERKLGYLALLRNLRNMADAGCDMELVKDAIVARRGADLVFPFRYVAASRAVPRLEPVIDQALCESIASGPRLDGTTVIAIDVSGSMTARLSARSDMTRVDAAATLGSVINGELRVIAFASEVAEVPPRRGMAGVDAVVGEIGRIGHGTNIGEAVRTANAMKHDRLIVITDEQSHDEVPDPAAERAYMINVASARNGVGYGRWTHIDGFSEAVIRFIAEFERER